MRKTVKIGTDFMFWKLKNDFENSKQWESILMFLSGDWLEKGDLSLPIKDHSH